MKIFENIKKQIQENKKERKKYRDIYKKEYKKLRQTELLKKIKQSAKIRAKQSVYGGGYNPSKQGTLLEQTFFPATIPKTTLKIKVKRKKRRKKK